jgi:hypothetical protein
MTSDQPPTPSDQSTSCSRAKWLVFSAVLAALAGFGAVLFYFDPARYDFYPGCLFHKLTALSCPGCGSLRAGHELVHGHIVLAFKFNPLLVVLAPVGLWFGLRELIWQASGKKLPALLTGWAGLWLLAVIVVAFGVARNCSWWPLQPLE